MWPRSETLSPSCAARMPCTDCSTRWRPASPSAPADIPASSRSDPGRVTRLRWCTSSLSTTSRPPAPEAMLRLPAGWVDRSVLTYVGPDEGDGSPSLVVTREELGEHMALGRFSAMQDAAVRAGFDGIELLEDRETTVAGHQAVRRTYRWRYEEQTMRQRTWSFVVDGVGYTIVASAPDSMFDGLRSVCAASMRA